MKKLLRSLKRAIHDSTAPNQARVVKERLRLAALPRYVETITDMPGFPCKIPDGPSFLASWKEIFDREIYDFRQSNNAPRILDCGANVGISCLFFRKRFPHAKITAFEPDPKIFEYLQYNLTRAGCGDIELLAKAVWSSNTTLQFQPEGSDAGRIDSGLGSKRIEIPAIRLRDFLNEPVDLLKMDIEGAETEVMLDIAPCLSNVRNLFVEYHSFAGQRQTLGIIIQTIIEAGFRIQAHPVNVSPCPFREIKNYLGMDMQLNIFAIRD